MEENEKNKKSDLKRTGEVSWHTKSALRDRRKERPRQRDREREREGARWTFLSAMV